MARSVKMAMGLWFLLAIIVFNVRYDWQTRMASHRFIASQVTRHRQGQPTLTINEGFRPMVREAAFDGAQWFVAVASAGLLLTFGAATFKKLNA
jgi:hypothetical protein